MAKQWLTRVVARGTVPKMDALYEALRAKIGEQGNCRLDYFGDRYLDVASVSLQYHGELTDHFWQWLIAYTDAWVAGYEVGRTVGANEVNA